jgi:hypothetical protein
LPGQFNNNGIAATPDGRTLIVVNTTSGNLFTIDARTGASSQIDLGGGSLPSGDGILLVGQKLLVLQNGIFPGTPNQIAVVRLSRHLTRGTIADTLSSPLFENATTVARNGGTLIAVNSQFNGAPIDPEPEVVVLPRH